VHKVIPRPTARSAVGKNPRERKTAEVKFTFQIRRKVFRKSFNILAIRGFTMLASISKVALIIEGFWVLRGLWSMSISKRGQYLWVTLYKFVWYLSKFDMYSKDTI
jgi:hypothetical protein